MKIGDGIIQVLRWYSDVSKQNFRRSYIRNGLMPYNVLISPEHSILPFQLRRLNSLRVVNTMDLYDVNDNLVMNILSALPAPTTDHIRIYNVGGFNNIVFNQKTALSSDMPCGYHYLHLSDGYVNFYSEVFNVIKDFHPVTETTLTINADSLDVDTKFYINDQLDELIINNSPY